MNVIEIMGYIADIESRHDIHDWKIDNVHVWPLIRFHIYFKLYEIYDPYYTVPSAPDCPKVIYNLYNLAKRALIYGVSYVINLKKGQALSKPYDVVILDDGISYDNRNGIIYDKFCDPLRRKLTELGKSTLILSIARKIIGNRYSASAFINTYLSIRILFCRHILRKKYKTKLAGLHDLSVELNHMHPNYNWQLEKEIIRQMENILPVAAYFDRLFKKNCPQEAYLVSYYGTVGLGFCLACRWNHIPVADIQHGAQGRGHVAYAGWGKIPEQGYELIPDFYACWSQNEVSAIEEWSKGTRYHPYILGNLYLEELLKRNSPERQKFQEYFQVIQEREKPQYNILVTLQIGINLTQKIIELLKTGQDKKVYFWIRLHPTVKNEYEKILSALRAAGVNNFDLRIATDTPLYTLLPMMDGHTTMNSSTVIEAAFMGVPSLILDETGKLYYSTYIFNRQAIYSDDVSQGFNNLILMMDNHDKKNTYKSSHSMLPLSALKEFNDFK